jgi:hypothetical protein
MARLLFFTGPQSENTPEIQSHREFECLKEILDKQQAIQLLLPTLTGKYSDLVRLLTESDGPDIFHFAGHGQGKDLRLLNDRNQQTLLGVEDATNLFKHCAQMGVVLNACSSASVAESISGSVRFAVGYRGKLLDEVAISFTKSFYRCLSDGRMLADAFEIAVLQSGGSRLHPDTQPVLFCHELDPENYSIGSKTTSNSEQKIWQVGDGSPMASNSAAANVNKGLQAGQMTINGSVTINNFNQDPNPQRQDPHQSAGMSVIAPASTASNARPSSALNIHNSRSNSGNSVSSHQLGVLVEYLKIALQDQQTVLTAIQDYFNRQGLIEVVRNDSASSIPEIVAKLLLSSISEDPNIPTTSRFAAICQDWRNRKMAFSDKGQKAALRAIRDAVFLASLPEEDTQEMVAAISNAIQKETPAQAGTATVPFWNSNTAEKLGRYAHALLMDQRNAKETGNSFLFELLNKNFDDTDTSILFEDTFYEYVFLEEPVGYNKKTTPERRIEEFAIDCIAQLEKNDNAASNPDSNPDSYKQVLISYLKEQHYRDRLVFVKISQPQIDRDINALEDVKQAFTRMVFIQMKPNGNATVYENIMRHMAQIDRSLTELFPN